MPAKWSNPILLLILAVVISTTATWFFIDRNKPSWLVEYWSIIGTNVSLIGFCFTLYQIRQIRSESSVIASTVEETRNKLFDLNKYGDLSKAVKIIQEIQSHTRGQKYEIAVMRLQDLKIIIGNLKVTNEHGSESTMDSHIESINFTIYDLEKEIESKGGKLRIAKLNSTLETMMDMLVLLQSKILVK